MYIRVLCVQACFDLKKNEISNSNVKLNTVTSFFLLFLHVALRRISYGQKFVFVRKYDGRVNVIRKTLLRYTLLRE